MITAFVLIRARGNRVQEIIAELPQKGVEGLDDGATQEILFLEGVERPETHLAFRTYPRRLLDQGFGLGPLP